MKFVDFWWVFCWSLFMMLVIWGWVDWFRGWGECYCLVLILFFSFEYRWLDLSTLYLIVMWILWNFTCRENFWWWNSNFINIWFFGLLEEELIIECRFKWFKERRVRREWWKMEVFNWIEFVGLNFEYNFVKDFVILHGMMYIFRWFYWFYFWF